eukprot:scaffold15.g4275.t1
MFAGTVYVGGTQDLRVDPSTGQSKCSLLVDSAADGRFGFTRLQFLVSQSWVDSGPRHPPPGWAGCANYTLSDYYCFSRFNSTEVVFYSYGRDDSRRNVPVDQAQIDEFEQLLQACFEHAVDRGFDIAVNVHADDGMQMNGWRNTLAFDPLEPFGNFSYVDAFLSPIADALAAALRRRPTTRVWLALQGEMGATVFFYPWSWVEVADQVGRKALPVPGPIALPAASRAAARRGLPRAVPAMRGLGVSSLWARHWGCWAQIREQIARGLPPGSSDHRVQLGFGINNSKLCGCVLADVVDYDVYLEEFAKLWPSMQDWVDTDGLRQAFMSMDFVGISAYVPQKKVFGFQPCEMENLMKARAGAVRMDVEFAYYNLTLKELNDAGYGIGGGISQNGDQKATTAEQAACIVVCLRSNQIIRTCILGIYGHYRRELDPWTTWEPESYHNPVRDYMRWVCGRLYYNQTSKYLLSGGCDYTASRPGAREGLPGAAASRRRRGGSRDPRGWAPSRWAAPSARACIQVGSAYLWNVASWDVIGMYPQAPGINGSYRDEVAVSIVRAHNARVRAAASPPPPAAQASKPAAADGGPRVRLLP